MTMTRVLLVDDDAEVRASLRLLLKNEPDMDVVGEARDGREAVQRALALTPDVVLMDVRMPVRNGLEAAQDLCARADGPQIIMLTVFDLDEYVYEAMKSGASGFLLKNSSPSSILSAIRAAREGASLLSPEITMRLIEHMAPMRPDKRLAHLTPARARDVGTDRAGTVQRRARGGVVHHSDDGSNLCESHHDQSRGARSGPTRSHRLRKRDRRPSAIVSLSTHAD